MNRLLSFFQFHQCVGEGLPDLGKELGRTVIVEATIRDSIVQNEQFVPREAGFNFGTLGFLKFGRVLLPVPSLFFLLL